MKKTIAMLLAAAMSLSLVACGGGASSSAPADPSTPAVQELPICLASEPDTLDPALNSALDGATMLVHLFSGLTKWSQDEAGNLIIVADAAEELAEGVVNEDGTVTYTYTLRDGMKWSDGQPVTAGDYEFAWKRAASTSLGGDYGYMFEVVKGYPDDLAVTAKDDKTLEVTLNNEIRYWDELMAFPTYFPVREDVVADEAWATDPSTYVCNGPYTITDWAHDSVITLTKNENFIDADSITMDVLKCYLSDDTNNMLTNYKNGDWLMIDDVPVNEIPNLKSEFADEFVVAGQIGTYYVSWNINQNILPADSTLTGAEAEAAMAEIRNALGQVLDRNYIVEEIAQGGQVPASSFISKGFVDADGTDFSDNAGGNDFAGYFDTSADAFESNYNAAIDTLKKYYAFDEATQQFTNFPTLTYLYNTADNHKAIGEYFQGAWSALGITVQLENQEWSTFLNTRKSGDFTVARNGWVADYTDPTCYVDMWLTNSGNNDVQYGKGDHAALAMYDLDLTGLGYDVKVEDGTWAETYDLLVSMIKTETDNEKRFEMMHMAEDMLMETGCIVPIYFYTDLYMLDSSVKGFYSQPLGYKYFMYTTIE